jgi:hypothetical protein
MKKKILILFSILIFIITTVVMINIHVLNFSKTDYYYDVDGLENKYV